MYKIEIAPKALKFLDHLKKSHAKIAEHIILAIDELKESPHKGKKLMGPLGDFRSLRVGLYRIIYTIIENQIIIQIVKITHHKDVYR